MRRRWLVARRCFATVVALMVLGSCQQPQPGLVPLEQPSALQPAAPRISGPIPTNRSQERSFEDRRAPAMAGAAGSSPLPPPGIAAGEGGDVTLNFVDADIREIVRAVLGTTLKVDYTIDPAVHGTGSIETPSPLPRSALLGTLEALLNQNGATMVERNGIYDIVPITAAAVSNLAAGRRGDRRRRRGRPAALRRGQGPRQNTGALCRTGRQDRRRQRRQRVAGQRRRRGAADFGRADPRFRHRYPGRSVVCAFSGRRRRPGQACRRTRKGAAGAERRRPRRHRPSAADGAGQRGSRRLGAAAVSRCRRPVLSPGPAG